MVMLVTRQSLALNRIRPIPISSRGRLSYAARSMFMDYRLLRVPLYEVLCALSGTHLQLQQCPA